MSNFLFGNERGETLVSVLVAGLVLLIVFMVSMPSLMRSYTDAHRSMARPQFCREVANNIAAQIRSSGIQTKVHRAPVRKNSIRFDNPSWRNGSGSFEALNEDGITDEHATDGPVDAGRWPASRIMQWNPGTNRFVANSPRLIHSAMNFLQAVNNSNSNRSCRLPRGIEINATNGLAQLLPAATLDMYLEAGYFVQASIKIQPFDITNDRLRSCNGGLALRPLSSEEPPRSDTLGITEDLASRYDAMTGFKTEVFVSIDHAEPGLRGRKDLIECSAKHSFQYDRIVSSIPAPRVETSGNVRVVLETQTQSYNGYGSGGGTINGASLSAPRRFQPGLFLACAYQYNFVNLMNGTFSGGEGNINRWVPCEDIRVCGNTSTTITEENDRVVFQTNRHIPGNCNLTVRAVAFDSVGNTSTETAAGCLSGSCQQTTITSGPGGGGGGASLGGYQVNGVSFGGPNAAAAAAAASALTGHPSIAIENPPPGSIANSRQMNGHASSMNSISSATASISSASSSVRSAAGGTPSGTAGGVAAASANVGAASANVGAASANVAAARDAMSAASSMSSSMGGISAQAQAEATEALAEAEAALAEAEAALAAAEAALAAEEAAKEAADADDDSGTI